MADPENGRRCETDIKKKGRPFGQNRTHHGANGRSARCRVGIRSRSGRELFIRIQSSRPCRHKKKDERRGCRTGTSHAGRKARRPNRSLRNSVPTKFTLDKSSFQRADESKAGRGTTGDRRLDLRTEIRRKLSDLSQKGRNNS